jgi:hypothetical protein
VSFIGKAGEGLFKTPIDGYRFLSRKTGALLNLRLCIASNNVGKISVEENIRIIDSCCQKCDPGNYPHEFFRFFERH